MKQILIVEDTVRLLDEMKDILIMEGYEVLIATNAYLAMVHLILSKPDLIITDIIMPEMDGYSFITSLKKNKETCYLPIIVLSSKNSTDDILRALAMKVDIYLTKPCTTNELLNSIDSLLKWPEKLCFN